MAPRGPFDTRVLVGTLTGTGPVPPLFSRTAPSPTVFTLARASSRIFWACWAASAACCAAATAGSTTCFGASVICSAVGFGGGGGAGLTASGSLIGAASLGVGNSWAGMLAMSTCMTWSLTTGLPGGHTRLVTRSMICARTETPMAILKIFSCRLPNSKGGVWLSRESSMLIGVRHPFPWFRSRSVLSSPGRTGGGEGGTLRAEERRGWPGARGFR